MADSIAVVSRRTAVSFASNFVGGVTLLHTNFHRKTNQNRSAQRQPISSLEGLLESPFTRLSYGEGFKSQLEAVSKIQLIL